MLSSRCVLFQFQQTLRLTRQTSTGPESAVGRAARDVVDMTDQASGELLPSPRPLPSLPAPSPLYLPPPHRYPPLPYIPSHAPRPVPRPNKPAPPAAVRKYTH